MKQVVCPACGLINLEKFVTFPHCAGCGALLPEKPSTSPTWWRRPLQAPMWATIIGLCSAGLGLLAIGIARETSQVDDQQLVVYVQVPHQVVVGQLMPVQLVLDTTAGDTSTSIKEFNDVQVRVSKAVFDNFTLVSVIPAPDQRASTGNGRYLIFESLRREQPVQLLLKPLYPHVRRLNITVLARDFYPFQYRSSVDVASPRTQTVPKSK